MQGTESAILLCIAFARINEQERTGDMVKYDVQDCLLTAKYQLTPTIYDFRLKNEELAELTRPGQFVHILIPGKTLRRPISVCDVENGEIRIVFEVRGEGTAILAECNTGSLINIIAPLGNGFETDKTKKTVFIGGGIGVPPMLYSAKNGGEGSVVINGFRDKSAVILSKDFRSTGLRVIETTDNGSYGIHGFVTEPLKEVIADMDRVCACGPMPMLKNIAKIAKEFNKPCFVSLEQRMACGVGACLGCAVAIKDGDSIRYKHVCKEGPVFSGEEVEWNG